MYKDDFGIELPIMVDMPSNQTQQIRIVPMKLEMGAMEI